VPSPPPDAAAARSASLISAAGGAPAKRKLVDSPSVSGEQRALDEHDRVHRRAAAVRGREIDRALGEVADVVDHLQRGHAALGDHRACAADVFLARLRDTDRDDRSGRARAVGSASEIHESERGQSERFMIIPPHA
jgi:hypothetical protein